MQTIVLETMCLPPISVMSTIVKHSTLLIEAQEHYQKRSYRNRIYLSGPQGKMLSSIPLKKGKNVRMPIQDVEISYEDPWDSILLKQLKSNYGSAPFFDYLYDDIEAVLNQKYPLLIDLNKALLDIIFRYLGCNTKVVFTKVYQKEYAAEITDWRNRFTPSKIQKEIPLKPYEQIFTDKHGFIPDLSILDLLMCRGPESPQILSP